VKRSLRAWSGAVALVGFAAGCAHGGGAASPASLTHASSARDTSAVLVRVGGHSITRATLQARIDSAPDQYKSMYGTPDGKRQLLDRMVEEQVWLDEAVRHGVADRAKVQEQIEQQRRDVLIRTYLTERMAANPAPSDSEAKGYYDGHLADYRTPASITVRHVQLKTEAEARRVLKLARAGKDFAALAKQYSADTLTGRGGGMLGSVTHDGNFPSIGRQQSLADSAFTLGAGQLGGPWKSDRGWHVVKVESVRPEVTRPFEQVRPMIVRQLGAQSSQDFYRRLLEQARDSLGVTPDSVAIRGFLSERKSEADLFKLAQETAAPADRIAAYREVLAQYPNGEKAAQSQFMIGFIESEELKNYPEAEQSFRVLLQRYPKSELAASAQWMIDHMRTDDVPAFITQEADTSRPLNSGTGKAARTPAPAPGSSGKP
jgi:peptidyl-prolyl cis-trans isomerase C